MAGITASIGRQHARGRRRRLDPLADEEGDLGLRAGMDELVEPHRLAVWHDHARCQLAVDRLVDAEGEALDLAGESQLRADDVLAGLHAVLDDERLGFVAGVRVEEGVHAAERSDGRAVTLRGDQGVGDRPRIGHAAAPSPPNPTVTVPRCANSAS